MIAGPLLLLETVVLAAAGRLALPAVARFMTGHGIVGANYEGRPIPSSMGLFIWLMVLLAYAGHMLVGGAPPVYTAYVLSLSVVAMIGWLDDTIGDKKVKGLRGHWNRWRREGVVSTGLLKVGAAASMAGLFLAAAGFAESAADWLLLGPRILLIMLATNMMNLLDLRPGRMLKGFFALGGVALVSSAAPGRLIPFMLPVVLAGILLYPRDAGAEWMLGDTGANLCGFALGCWLVLGTPLWLQAGMLLLLGLLHAYAEKRSITAFIESNRVLNWLDRLGRRAPQRR